MVVAVSGGADSVALLLAIDDLTGRKKLGHRIVAAHFDHGLRGKASRADAEFIIKLAADLGVDVVIKKGSVATRGNLEQNARDARYSFLAETAEAQNAFAVVTGHTMNDQAETFLMNLIRGSGIDGLGAMPEARALNTDGAQANVRLIRPLLNWAMRADTERYCGDRGVEFRHDVMNDDPAFRRVRVRKELIPLLEQMNPKVVEALARTAKLISAVETDQPPITHELSTGELREMDEIPRLERIREWIKVTRGSLRGITSEHIRSLERLSLSTKSGRIAELPGGFCVRRSGGKLMFEQNKVENVKSAN